jgi:pimeloyl-ACP methyl ester carboxylesterase
MSIFGLFVGINNYPTASHRLKGCVADMNAFHDYIKARATQDKATFSAAVLTDKKATRANIIAGFDVFAQAKAGDTCVLYFSGHGSHAPVPLHEGKPMFNETDGMTESIIAYDSRSAGGSDILDKELGFLIYNATFGKNIHFLCVFDCCHAGGNTRNFAVPARARMAEPAKMPTKIEDVLGFQQGFFTKNNKGFFDPKPENNYIALAAARSNQTAKEVEMPDKQTRGVFTYMLLETLKTQGANQTYTNIVERINLNIRNMVADQNPLVEATMGSDLEEQPFLGGALQGNNLRPSIGFDKNTNTWQLNQGSINGIAIAAIVRIKGDARSIKLSEVQTDTAYIDADFAKNLDKKTIYEAEIIDLGTPKTQIAFTTNSDKKGQKLITDFLKNTPSNFFELTKNMASAEYLINATADFKLRLLPFGKQDTMFRSVEGGSNFHSAQAKTFVTNTEKVLLHAKLCKLENPRTTIDTKDIEIAVFKIDETNFKPADVKANVSSNKMTWAKGQKGVAVKDVNAPIVVQYFDDKVIPMFRLNLKNTSGKTYFVGSVVAFGNYELINDHLQNKVMELGKGENVWLEEGTSRTDTLLLPMFRPDEHPAVKFVYPDYITEINVTVKIIISTSPFNIDQYAQDALELEPFRPQIEKGISWDSLQNEPLNDANWTVKTINFTVLRKPIAQQITAKGAAALKGMTLISNSKMEARATLSTRTSGTRDMGMAASGMAAMGMEAFNMNRGFEGMPALNVLELHDIDAEMAKTVTKTDPIVVKLDAPLAANEVVVPLGYIETKDENGNDVKWFYPLGGTISNGKNDRDTIQINALPDPMTEGTRSFTGAIKVFFQKVVLQKTDIQMLREVAIKPDPEGGFITEYQTYGAEKLTNYSEPMLKKHHTQNLSEKVKTATNIVIFIHGIIGDTEIMVQTMKRIGLEKRYDLALAFDYESLDTRIPDTAKAFQAKLAEIGIDDKCTKNVHIIAHSMGGLVSRFMLEKGKNPPKIAHLIQVGTPNNGSPWGDFQAMVQLFLPRLINAGGTALGLPPFVTKIIGYGAGLVFDKINNTLEDMQPDSKFMKLLNDKTDSKVKMTIIAGNTRLLVQERAFFARVFNQYSVLNNTLFNGDNDMAVTVNSIHHIEGGEKRTFPPTLLPMIPCDHVSYFMNKEGLEMLDKAVADAF